MRGVFVCLAILGGALVACAQQQPKPFSFVENFQGEWDVQRSTLQLKGGKQVLSEVLGHYTIRAQNGSLNLVGRSYDNDTATGEVTSKLAIEIEMSTNNAGTFRTGLNEDDMHTLFSFEFQDQHNGMAIAHGEWAGSAPSYYEFVFASWDRFTITVFPAQLAAENPEVTIFTGRRIPENKEKTFFQKYGSMIMIGGFFVFNMFMQKKAQGRMGGAGAGNGREGPAPESETATVEEVTEDEAKAESKKDK